MSLIFNSLNSFTFDGHLIKVDSQGNWKYDGYSYSGDPKVVDGKLLCVPKEGFWKFEGFTYIREIKVVDGKLTGFMVSKPIDGEKRGEPIWQNAWHKATYT